MPAPASALAAAAYSATVRPQMLATTRAPVRSKRGSSRSSHDSTPGLLNMAYPLPAAGEDLPLLDVVPASIDVGVGTKRHRLGRIGVVAREDHSVSQKIQCS